VDSRWFAGSAECHRVLGRLFRGSTGRGAAFSSQWPYLEAGGRIVAPAVPVVVGSAELTGPDGEYAVEDRTVWREAMGVRRPLLALEGTETATEPEFDLLWFGANERYVVRRGLLEVEDLFSRLRLPVTSSTVEQLLIRGLRVAADALDGVVFARSEAKAELEVGRPLELVASDGWRDPWVVMGGRADIATVEGRGDEMVAKTLTGTTVVFKVVVERPGWRVFAWEGDYPYQTLVMSERQGCLSWSATLSDGMNPLSRGVRSQIAFDLRSDLISLKEPCRSPGRVDQNS
jgi:hypothetical protein